MKKLLSKLLGVKNQVENRLEDKVNNMFPSYDISLKDERNIDSYIEKHNSKFLRWYYRWYRNIGLMLQFLVWLVTGIILWVGYLDGTKSTWIVVTVVALHTVINVGLISVWFRLITYFKATMQFILFWVLIGIFFF